MKKLTLYLLLWFFILYIPAYGQVNGEYRSLTNGAWSSPGTWQKRVGGVWVSATDYPSSSTFLRKVSVLASHAVTGDIDVFGNGAFANLEVLGTLNMGSFNILGSNTGRIQTLNTNGSLNTSGYVSAATFNLGPTGAFNTSYLGSEGWWANYPGSVSLSGTVEFSGPANQRIPSYEYSNVIVSGTAPKTAIGLVIVNNLLTINSGATMNVYEILIVNGTISLNGVLQAGPLSTIDVVNLDIFNNNGLKLKSDATGTASLIISGALNGGQGATGNTEIELYLTGAGTPDNTRWHYISTPITSLPVSTFAPGTTLDLVQYVESYPNSSLMQGWVAYDGYIYTGGTGGPTFSSLTPGKGYNFWDNNDNTFTFSGMLNTADIAVGLNFSGNPSLHGYNLLGNPFASGLNWDDIITNVYSPFPGNTSQALYFTREDQLCSYVAGVGEPGDVTGIIPPMQGFFTKTYTTGNTITLSAGARTHSGIHNRYKGTTIIPLVRLKLKRTSTITDETVVRFDEKASPGFDYTFDAIKIFGSPDKIQIYSSIGGINYSINGQPFPESFIDIPIAFNLTKDTIHSISASQLQALDNYSVTLRDNTTGTTTDLKTNPVVTFTGGPGTINGRFILKISKLTTGVEMSMAAKSIFNIYSGDRSINIRTVADEWDGKSGSVKVLDLTGRVVIAVQYAEFSRNSEIRVPVTGRIGLFIVEIKSGMLRYVEKVIVK